MDVRPFTIAVEDSVLEDLQQRLADTRWPDEIPNTGWDYGSNLAYLQELVEHWRTKFDWRAQEEAINKLAYDPVITGLGSAHVMGGCAMGQDESQCVVNSDGSYKYLNGLYIIDGSVFPTSLGVNPQLTIYGMSARNASTLASKLKG